jgi:hypothetical protein
MSPGSPRQLQSASLGRASAGGGIGLGMGIVNVNGGNCVNGNRNGNVVVSGANGNAGGGSPVPRRNSLGDLRIPARISQAQVSLRRDIRFVREFAASIERMSIPLLFFFFLAIAVANETIILLGGSGYRAERTSPAPIHVRALISIRSRSTHLLRKSHLIIIKR